jgi:hypothetical protein
MVKAQSKTSIKCKNTAIMPTTILTAWKKGENEEDGISRKIYRCWLLQLRKNSPSWL